VHNSLKRTTDLIYTHAVTGHTPGTSRDAFRDIEDIAVHGV